ncbi:MAG: SGNH/GDSL hydrolase family protein [Niabella sp.]
MNTETYPRKQFLRTCIAGMGLITTGDWFNTSGGWAKGRKLHLQKNDIIVFTGDSITDGAREREIYASPNVARGLGLGYVTLTASRLLANNPDLNLKVHNTGINGNTIKNLLGRWDTACLRLKPTVLSILVGVNDFNVSFSATGKGDTRRYEQEYRELLKLTKSKLPGVRLVIGEPYALKGAREKIDDWYPSFNEYREIARKIAAEFNAVFIPYQELYERKAKKAPPKFYSTDGIHPSLAGIQLMSDAWYNIL